jgi:methyl-accepting chemotaxis protein
MTNNASQQPKSVQRAGNQRKMRNFLLKPVLQLQLSVYTLGLTVFFSGMLAAVTYMTFRQTYELILDVTNLPQDVADLVNEYIANSAGWLVGAIILYLVINILITIIFTHRLIGPTIAFRRHVRALIDGNYSSRINLRKGDAFVEVAEDLNSLAEHLGKKKG